MSTDDTAATAKKAVSDILGNALDGSEPRYRTDDSRYIRWGMVEREMLVAIDAAESRLKAERDAARQYAVTMEDMATRCKRRREEDAEEVKRVKAERDRLIAMWPGRSGSCVYLDPSDGKFRANDGRDVAFKTLEAAVRNLVGLDPEAPR